MPFIVSDTCRIFAHFVTLLESTVSSTKDQRARITKSAAGAQPASVFSTLGLYPSL